jgi:hypothetical protein
MASGCQAWPAFGARPSRPTQENLWIAEIDRQWPNLNNNERQ